MDYLINISPQKNCIGPFSSLITLIRDRNSAVSMLDVNYQVLGTKYITKPKLINVLSAKVYCGEKLKIRFSNHDSMTPITVSLLNEQSQVDTFETVADSDNAQNHEWWIDVLDGRKVFADIGNEQTLQLVLKTSISIDKALLDIQSISVDSEGYTSGNCWFKDSIENSRGVDVLLIN